MVHMLPFFSFGGGIKFMHETYISKYMRNEVRVLAYMVANVSPSLILLHRTIV